MFGRFAALPQEQCQDAPLFPLQSGRREFRGRVSLCDFAPGRLCSNASAVKTRKSWREKLADDKGLPKVDRVEGKLSPRWGTGVMLIPAPREVDALMKRVPRGQVTTINELRTALAKKHQADFACPMTTGIFSWIAAHAAAEAAAEGRKRITPYWRTLKSGGELNPKYPGGIPALKKLLRGEGHKVEQRGKRFFVADFQERLCAVQ